MRENELTSPDFWKTYWESKNNLVFSLTRRYELGDLIESYLANKNIRSAIELGGFPGYYAVLLKKFYQLDTTLLDYYIHRQINQDLCLANGLQPADIQVIEADLFAYTPTPSYDLVISCGLIEHFEDLEDILAKHLAFVKPGGHVLITLPNFRGVNGWVQKTFDVANYEKHNVKIMDRKVLETAAKHVGMIDVKTYYFRRFSVWLEEANCHPLWVRGLVKGIWVAGKVITKIFPFDSKWLSPYIVLEAKKVQ
ncbi:MAG: class I SAM-dependent methyltransferase [Spirosomataceae bacterium]